MSIEQTLQERSGNQCELCSSADNLSVYALSADNHSDKAILTCQTCLDQINGEQELQANHWHCLNDSMWSTVPVVQVMAWRMLKRLSVEPWAQDLLDMLYLDDDLLAWAQAGVAEEEANGPKKPTRDCNGTELTAGDTVHLIKDLVVKGANFTAKRGTAVRNIALPDNHEHIEGRINGTRVVLLSSYMKKS